MAVLPILTYPDPFLAKPVKTVTEITDEVQEVIENMAETMYIAPGVGLAAIQAGIDKRIIVYDPDSDSLKRDFQVLINPCILEYHGSTISEEEGCLSVPDMRCDIKRAERIIVEGLDREGNSLQFEAEGIPAIILQHEIDHLNGVLILDRISTLKRQIYKRKCQKNRKNE
ncbi:MAG: peptide deformylase [Desulfosalsimonadaceae bacterium]